MSWGEGKGNPSTYNPSGSLSRKENQAGELAPGCHHSRDPSGQPAGPCHPVVCVGTHAHECAVEEGWE